MGLLTRQLCVYEQHSQTSFSSTLDLTWGSLTESPQEMTALQSPMSFFFRKLLIQKPIVPVKVYGFFKIHELETLSTLFS